MRPGHLIVLVIVVGLVVGWVTARDEGKTQGVRVLDVAIVGPLMIAAGVARLPVPLRLLLVFIGAATITFNARNYQRTRASLEPAG
jgi:hypothetical protein